MALKIERKHSLEGVAELFTPLARRVKYPMRRPTVLMIALTRPNAMAIIAS